MPKPDTNTPPWRENGAPMSQLSDPTLTLFTLHGLAVSLRDRADIISERAEALLTHVEGAIAQQMRGEPIVLGIRPKQAPLASGAGFPAPLGAPLGPRGAQRAQAHMVAPEDSRLGLCASPSPQPPTAGTPQSPRRRATPPATVQATVRRGARTRLRDRLAHGERGSDRRAAPVGARHGPASATNVDRGHRADALLPVCRARRLGSGHPATEVDRRKGACPLRVAPRQAAPRPTARRRNGAKRCVDSRLGESSVHRHHHGRQPHPGCAAP
jgi:hypothetical protein